LLSLSSISGSWMKCDYGAVVEWQLTGGNQSTWRKPVWVPTCPPQISCYVDPHKDLVDECDLLTIGRASLHPITCIIRGFLPLWKRFYTSGLVAECKVDGSTIWKVLFLLHQMLDEWEGKHLDFPKVCSCTKHDVTRYRMSECFYRIFYCFSHPPPPVNSVLLVKLTLKRRSVSVLYKDSVHTAL
jgi:hypothetical protein